MCQNKCCEDEIEQLKKQITSHENQIKEKEETYRQALVHNWELDCVIENMEDELRTKWYKQFEMEVSTKIMLQLQAFSLSKVDDCKFVTTILRGIFAENIEQLKNMTATGRGNEKSAIPPEKFEIIEKFYIERMVLATKNGEPDVIERTKLLNKNLKNALETINR